MRALILTLLCLCSAAAEPQLFFAFDNGIGRGTWTPEQQAELVASLGYGGIGFTGTEHLAERLAACDAHGLRIPSLYLPCRIDRQPSYVPGLPEALPLIGKRGIILWLTVEGKGDDEAALRAVREVADLAKPFDVRIALYPHFGLSISTARQGLAFIHRLDRTNVRLSLTLCHELRAGNRTDLSNIINEVASQCLLVSINGADAAGSTWSSLIRPLGDGDLDMLAILRDLRAAGYHGPIGLQGYQIPGEPRDNLTRSIDAWRKYQAALER